MDQRLEKRIKKLYDDLEFGTGFKYKQYLKEEPHRLCRKINLLAEAATASAVISGPATIPNLLEMINKIKSFVC